MPRNTRTSSGRPSVTLKDVAERVGVTSSAASMALGGHGRISEKTRQAIREAAAELGYVPSSAGRALRNQRSGAVALIVPDTSQHVLGHSYFMHVLTGISAAANARDVQVILSTTTEEAGDVAAYQRVVRSRSADGAIVTSAAVTDPGLEALVASGLPVVLIGNFPYLPDAVSVGIDDVAASRRATEHLLDVHGRTELVHVTGPLDHQTGIDRRIGFLDAIEASGGRAHGRLLEGDFSEAAGRQAVESLLGRGTGVDGIVFANDDMAFGGLQALKAAGRSVPGDVSIVGFDDFGLSRVTTPGITTMRAPAEDMARRATERLFRVIDGSGGSPDRLTLPVDLVVRDSCGCPAA
ncbi:transcriptional regulator [Frondihabitans sucicola]|uniref:Transcriptional regulator n=1 Tax=Frondihabitans sucicola TaxID=1268041 RepID=A0ABN6Y4J5_9MICO|nr:LacI family DNA-binding transcriptional regulator [Frondihabitans sucicola]BDZ52229.1 transcriptional regulator [Frondihabitans sucicola]